VQTVQLDQQWQVGIQTGEGLIWYSGLQECHRNVGDSVAAGDLIGFTGDKLYIQALR
jgi:septal ring factor EnvC (AmiA/AmiB activator)